MTALATDDFNRADSDPIGGNWTTITGQGALRVVSNTLANHADGTDCGAYYNAVSWPNDQYSQMQLTTTIANDNDGGPGVRISSSAATYYFVTQFDANSRVFKNVAGTFTQVGTTGIAFNANDIIYMSAQGTTITNKVNGVTNISGTDSAIGSGSAGVGDIFRGNLRFDNWEGGDFSPGVATTQTPARTLRGAGI